MSLETALAVYEESNANYSWETAAPAFNASNLPIHEENNVKYGPGKQVTPTAPPLTPLEEVIPEAIFRAEIAIWAKRMGVEPKEVHLRPMKRKWASCSRKGRLTFDTALLSQPAAFRAEVIVHELLHLKVPNHGPVFRALMRGIWRSTNIFKVIQEFRLKEGGAGQETSRRFILARARAGKLALW